MHRRLPAKIIMKASIRLCGHWPRNPFRVVSKTVLDVATDIADCVINDGFSSILQIMEVINLKIGPNSYRRSKQRTRAQNITILGIVQKNIDLPLRLRARWACTSWVAWAMAARTPWTALLTWSAPVAHQLPAAAILHVPPAHAYTIHKQKTPWG